MIPRSCTFILVLFFLVFFSASILAQPGSLDNTFNFTGKTITDIGRSACQANACVVQTNGKIIVGGSYMTDAMKRGWALARFNANGSLDTSFSGNGIAGVIIGTGTGGIEGAIQSLALQTDGKIIAGGFSFYGHPTSGAVFTVGRFLDNGSLDSTFGNGGLVLSTTLSRIFSIKIQNNGKIVAAGSGGLGFAVARYNIDGTPDTTFVANGTVSALLGNFCEGSSVCIQSDGKIVVGGSTYDGLTNDFGIIRFQSNGAVDSSFGVNGQVVLPIGTATDKLFAMAIQTDGKIIAGGTAMMTTYDENAIARLNTNGSLDTTFSSDGIVTVAIGPYGDMLNSITLQTDNKIVTGGYSSDMTNSFSITRFLTDGSLDTSFNSTGIKTIDFGILSAWGSTVAMAPGNKIVLAGFVRSSMDTLVNFAVVQCNPDGSDDITFSTDGKTDVNLGMGGDKALVMAIQADGKIIAAGTSVKGNFTQLTLIRYNSNGSVDTSFGTNGFAFLSGDIPSSIAIQPNGKILVGIEGAFGIYRVHPNGTLDSAFGMYGNGFAGVFDFFIGSSTGTVKAIELQADGKIVAAGYAGAWPSFDKDFALARFDSSGILDTSFSSDGKVLTNITVNQYDEVYALTLQQDGKIIAAGTASYISFALTRYDTNGSPDSTFGTNGIITTSFNSGGSGDFAHSVVVQPDGKIIAGGTSGDTSLSSHFALVRYLSNGTLDASFGTNGKVLTSINTHTNVIRSLVLQPDSKILAGGFSGMNDYINVPLYDFTLTRYDSTGALDGSFGLGGIVTTSFGNLTDEGRAMTMQADGKIVMAGFSDNGTDNDFALARYLSGLIVGVIDFESMSNSTFIYPNPVSENVILEYTLTSTEKISIRLIDMQGRIISTFVDNQQRKTGTHKEYIHFPETMPAGSYLINIASENKQFSILINK